MSTQLLLQSKERFNRTSFNRTALSKSVDVFTSKYDNLFLADFKAGMGDTIVKAFIEVTVSLAR